MSENATHQPNDADADADAHVGTENSGDPLDAVRRRVLAAALPNAPFDGFSDSALAAAGAEASVDRHELKLAFPRGGIDLAMFFHREGDREMLARLAETDLEAMRVRERVSFAVRTRLEIAARQKDAVRKGAALFALPIYAADGARAVWETADHIWVALGDPSDDLNWYSKRAILSGVYSSTTLFWLGDESPGSIDTWAFLDRRIEGVMRFEKFKSQLGETPLGRMMTRSADWVASRIRKPTGGFAGAGYPDDLPVDLPGGR